MSTCQVVHVVNNNNNNMYLIIMGASQATQQPVRNPNREENTRNDEKLVQLNRG